MDGRPSADSLMSAVFPLPARLPRAGIGYDLAAVQTVCAYKELESILPAYATASGVI